MAKNREKFLRNLYTGQKYEYKVISELYALKWDAFKLPIDGGLDLVANPSPLFPVTQVGFKHLFLQVKSVCVRNKNSIITDWFSKKQADEQNRTTGAARQPSTKCFYANIEINKDLLNLAKDNDIKVVLIVYMDFSTKEVSDLLYNGSTIKPAARKKELGFWLDYNELSDLLSNGNKDKYLFSYKDDFNKTEFTENLRTEIRIDEDKRQSYDTYRLYFRLQGAHDDNNKTQSMEKHEFEFWIQGKDMKSAKEIPQERLDISSIFNSQSELETTLYYDEQKFKDLFL